MVSTQEQPGGKHGVEEVEKVVVRNLQDSQKVTVSFSLKGVDATKVPIVSLNMITLNLDN